MSIINGRQVGGGAPVKTITLVNEKGEEITAVVIGKDFIFDATAEDVKEGKTFASDLGVDVGVNEHMHNAQHGTCLINPGDDFSVTLSENDEYNYAAFQAIIIVSDISAGNSMFANKIVLDNAVYDVASGEKVSDVTKNHAKKSVDFNLVNDTDSVCVVHYITYK